MIFQTQIIWSNRIHSLKYLRSTTFGSKDIVIRKSEFVAKTQFLYPVSKLLCSSQDLFNKRSYDWNIVILQITLVWGNTFLAAVLLCEHQLRHQEQYHVNHARTGKYRKSMYSEISEPKIYLYLWTIINIWFYLNKSLFIKLI